MKRPPFSDLPLPLPVLRAAVPLRRRHEPRALRPHALQPARLRLRRRARPLLGGIRHRGHLGKVRRRVLCSREGSKFASKQSKFELFQVPSWAASGILDPWLSIVSSAKLSRDRVK